MQPIQVVIDETGAAHSLLQRIGVGGQGEVWLTEGGRRIVKLLNSRANADAMRRQFAFVRRLELAGLHVARPIAVLRPPHVGYVAEFLDEMIPISELRRVPSEESMQWHINTGGLRRRLRLLAHAGEALMGLHAKGVIYADISDRNVFVSKKMGATEAWLIDLDNLSHDSDPKKAIYTPGYGAPEVVNGTAGCTSLSDAWAFAVLVWQTLTLTQHPFVGDLVSDGDPDEMEVQAFEGKIPWVGHSTDDSNRCSAGIQPKHALAGKLYELARRTFEDGVVDRGKRPGVSEWVERLHLAADQTVTCPGCGGSYFANEPCCPWCEDLPPFIATIRIDFWQPNHGIVGKTLGRIPLTSEGLVLSRRVTEGLTGVVARDGHLELKLVDKGISVSALPGHEAWLVPVGKANEARYSIAGRSRVISRDGWIVFFKTLDQPQWVLVVGRTN